MSIPVSCLLSVDIHQSWRDRKDAALGTAVVLADVSKEPENGFGPLNSILGAISAAFASHEVRLQFHYSGLPFN